MPASRQLRRLFGAVVFLGLITVPVAAKAQSLSYAPVVHFGPFSFQPSEPQAASPDTVAPSSNADELAPALRRQIVSYAGTEPPGTIIIDTGHTFLYLTLGNGRALRYGIGVGREGFTWSGVETITRKSEWPDWTPPSAMVARQPYLPRWVAGGPGNPLGARALYLGHTDYRIHGTNSPSTIGQHVSSGCIRMRNEDVIDLYGRVAVGTKVIVLPNTHRAQISQEAPAQVSRVSARATSRSSTLSGVY